MYLSHTVWSYFTWLLTFYGKLKWSLCASSFSCLFYRKDFYLVLMNYLGLLMFISRVDFFSIFEASNYATLHFLVNLILSSLLWSPRECFFSGYLWVVLLPCQCFYSVLAGHLHFKVVHLLILMQIHRIFSFILCHMSSTCIHNKVSNLHLSGNCSLYCKLHLSWTSWLLSADYYSLNLGE